MDINENKNRNSNMNFINRNIINNTLNKNYENNNIQLNNISNNFEFNELLNKISTLLKDYFHNDNLYLNNIKLISESINEQTLFARCSINDIMLYLNQITYPRFNGVMANINEKYIKEKLTLINNRLGKIDELKENMNQNIRNTEIELITYYEESKNFLQKIKILYKYENNSINNTNKYYNVEQIEMMKNKYNKLLHENNKLKLNLKLNNSIKDNNSVKNKDKKKFDFISLGNIRNNSCSRMNSQKNNINTNYSVGMLGDHFKNNKNLGKNININVINNKQYKYRNNRNKSYNTTNTNSLTLSKSREDLNKNSKLYKSIIIELASMIINFLNDMKNLQEYIIKKNNNIKEFKKNFELNKKSLRIFCEKIMLNKNSPEKIKPINIKNIKLNNSNINENKTNETNKNKKK